MSSLPDFDANNRDEALDPNNMNRAMVGVYEMGSTFKGFTAAMALDSGAAKITDSFDATHPLAISGFLIHDFHAHNTWLTVPEIFIYSSNIGAGRMALATGLQAQHDYLQRFGLLDTLHTELPETGAPIVPKMPWAEVTRVTMAFGHGISVSPMQTAVAGAALINGGYYITPTFLPRTEAEAEQIEKPILKPETSDLLRRLFRLNVIKGSGKSAGVPGYNVGGKTGTAEKVENGRYSATKRRNAFLAAFPMDAPKYLVLVVLDEPKPEKPGMGATAGLNAAPTVGNIIRRIAPMLGVEPRPSDSEDSSAMALAFAR
jgi:cell division protein FtsI (penicillin-binding protein 3)